MINMEAPVLSSLFTSDSLKEVGDLGYQIDALHFFQEYYPQIIELRERRRRTVAAESKLSSLERAQLWYQILSVNQEQVVRNRAITKILDHAEQEIKKFGEIGEKKEKERIANIVGMDINQLLKSYPDTMMEPIVENLSAVQLTAGCNGFCADCLFGTAGRVRAKFSLESLEEWIKTNFDYIKINALSFFAFYSHSDIFDFRGYRSIDNPNNKLEPGATDYYSFWSLFKIVAKKDEFISLSTAVPVGGISDFVSFFINSYFEMKQNSSLQIQLRVSIWEHNFERALYAELLVAKALKDRGESLADINGFFNRCLRNAPRIADNEILKVGRRIDEAGRFPGPSMSPTCIDSTIIQPDSNMPVFASIETAPSPFVPSGEVSYPIKSGSSPKIIPKKNLIFGHPGNYIIESVADIEDSTTKINLVFGRKILEMHGQLVYFQSSLQESRFSLYLGDKSVYRLFFKQFMYDCARWFGQEDKGYHSFCEEFGISQISASDIELLQYYREYLGLYLVIANLIVDCITKVTSFKYVAKMRKTMTLRKLSQTLEDLIDQIDRNNILEAVQSLKHKI